MARWHLFEFEDLGWFPHALRNYQTDALTLLFTTFASRTPIVDKLGELLDRAGCDTILDLCSGSSGALPWFRRRLEAARGKAVQVVLTDRYPNLPAFEALRRRERDRFDYRAEPVDATAVPAELAGVRTLFAAFHHFRPGPARGILEDAARNRRAIGVFEPGDRSLMVIPMLLLCPLLVLLGTPLIRPFRFGRLFWTYLVPIVPLLVLWDGIVSCLRIYTPQELERMVATIDADGYAWEIGRFRVRGTPLRNPYLLGYPTDSRS